MPRYKNTYFEERLGKASSGNIIIARFFCQSSDKFETFSENLELNLDTI